MSNIKYNDERVIQGGTAKNGTKYVEAAFGALNNGETFRSCSFETVNGEGRFEKNTFKIVREYTVTGSGEGYDNDLGNVKNGLPQPRKQRFYCDVVEIRREKV